MQKMRLKSRNDRGIALIFSLVMIGLLLVLALSFVTSSIMDQRASINHANSIVARGLAQSTATKVLAMMETYGNITAYSHSDNGTKDFLSALNTDGVFTYSPTANADMTWEFIKAQDQGDNRILGRVAYVAVPDRVTNDDGDQTTQQGVGLDPAACVKPGVDEGTVVEDRIGATMDEINLRSLNPELITPELATKMSYTDAGGVLPLPAIGVWIDFPTMFNRLGSITDEQKQLLKSCLMVDPPASKEVFALDRNADNAGQADQDIFNRFQLNKSQAEWDSMTVSKLLAPPALSDSDNPNSGGLAWLRYFGTKWDADRGSFVYDEDLKGTFALTADRRNQIAANLIDYNDSDNIPTSDVDPTDWTDISQDGPAYTGNEKTPYLNEIGCYVQSMVENNPDTNTVNVHVDGFVAPELVNLYGSAFNRPTAVKLYGSYQYTVRFKEKKSAEDNGDIIPPGEEEQPDGEDHPLYDYPKYTFWAIDDEHAKVYYYVMNADNPQVKVEGSITGLVSTQGGVSDIESMKISDNGYIYFIDRDRGSQAKLYRIDPNSLDKNPNTKVPVTLIGSTGVASNTGAALTNFEFLADGRVVGIGHYDGHLYTIDLTTGRQTLVTKLYLNGHRWSHTVDGIAQAADGTVYFTHTGRYYDNRHRYRSSYETELYKFTDLDAGTIEKVMNIHGSAKVEALAAHPDGNLYCADDYKWYRVNPVAKTTEVVTEFHADIEGMDFHWPSEVIKQNSTVQYATNPLADCGMFAGGNLGVGFSGSLWFEGNCHANGSVSLQGSHQWGPGSSTINVTSCTSITGRGNMAGGCGWNHVKLQAPSVHATPWGDYVQVNPCSVQAMTLPDIDADALKAIAQANGQVRNGHLYKNKNWKNVPGGILWFNGDVTIDNRKRHKTKKLNCLVVATGNITVKGKYKQWDCNAQTCGLISLGGSVNIQGSLQGKGLFYAKNNITLSGSMHCLKGQFLAGGNINITGSLRVDEVDHDTLAQCLKEQQEDNSNDDNGNNGDDSGDQTPQPEPTWQTVTVTGSFATTVNMSNNVVPWHNGYKMSWSDGSASFINTDDRMISFTTHEGYEFGEAEVVDVKVNITRGVVQYDGKNVDIALLDSDLIDADSLSTDLAAIDFNSDTQCTGKGNCQCARHRYCHRHGHGSLNRNDNDVSGHGRTERARVRNRCRHRKQNGACCSTATLMQLTDANDSWKKYYLAGSISAIDPRQNLNPGDWLVKSVVVNDDSSDPVMNAVKAYRLAGGSVAAANYTADTSSVYKTKFSPYKSYLADPSKVDLEKNVNDPVQVSTNRIRNAAMQSPWEIGFIHRGAAWQTINLKKFDTRHAVGLKDGSTIGIYAQGDANVLDEIKMTDGVASPSKVDLKIANVPVLKALLDRIKVNTAGISDMAGHNSGTMVSNLDDVANAIINDEDIITRASIANLELNDKNVFSGGVMATQDNDAAQEEIIGKFINLTSTISPIAENTSANPEYFTVIVAAQAIKDVGAPNGGVIKLKKRFSDGTVHQFDATLGNFDVASMDTAGGTEYAYADEVTASYKLKLLVKRDLVTGKCRVVDIRSADEGGSSVDNNDTDTDNNDGDVDDGNDGGPNGVDDPSGDVDDGDQGGGINPGNDDGNDDSTPDFDIQGDKVVAQEQLRVSVELIGMAYDYGYNDPIPVSAWWSVDNGQTQHQLGDGNLNPVGGYQGNKVWDLGVYDAGTEVTLRMQNQDSPWKDRNTWTTSDYIKVQRDGDVVPDISAAFPWQDTLKGFLTDIIDPDTSVLHLDPADVLIAAELSTLTGSGADWNDAIFLIHFESVTDDNNSDGNDEPAGDVI